MGSCPGIPIFHQRFGDKETQDCRKGMQNTVGSVSEAAADRVFREKGGNEHHISP